MGMFDFGKKKRTPKPKGIAASVAKIATRKVRKEARKSVKSATGKPGGSLFDWLFGK